MCVKAVAEEMAAAGCGAAVAVTAAVAVAVAFLSGSSKEW